MVTNKNVVIIGHSPTVLLKSRDIDKYDVVVRLNKGYPRKGMYKYIGKRTDIWFSWDVWDYNAIKDKFNAKEWISFDKYPRAMFDKLKQEQGQLKAPTMGMLAYYYLLQKKPKSISLYGFDFFKTPDFNSPPEAQQQHTRHNKYHDSQREELWFWRTKPSFVKFYDENNKEVKEMKKDINNKAILEPRSTKSIKPSVKVKCSTCGYAENVSRTRCWNCNAEL